MTTANSKPLTGQIALVTGGGHGIGAAISERLACMGASVIICGRNRTALDSAVSNIKAAGASAHPHVCDVTDLASVEDLRAFVDRDFHRLDILVNNAGIGIFGKPLIELTPEQWDSTLNTNLRGVFYLIRTFAPIMIAARSGHIVNISSIAGKNALPNAAAYAASKWGLNGLSYSVAEELRQHNIRVSVVCPGSTESNLNPGHHGDPTKILKPTDIANVVAMLVTQSPQSFASEIIIRPTTKP